jgi:hypothetical protein
MSAWRTPEPVGLREISRGEADEVDKSLFPRQAVTAVRYADTAAWVTAAAIARAIAPVQEETLRERDRVAVLVTSDHGPEETIAALARAAREGYSSPLRFPAGNPGSLVGVSCILMGFRGPTLNLLMPPAEGIQIAWFMTGRWLQSTAAHVVAAAICRRLSPGRYLARAVLLGHREADGNPAEWDVERTTAWMVSEPDVVRPA